MLDLGRPWDPRTLAQSALLVALLVAGVADLMAESWFFGAPIASAVLWPSAAILVGLAAFRANRPGAGPVLLSGAIVGFLINGAELIDPTFSQFRAYPGGLSIHAAASIVAIIAALGALAILREPIHGTRGIRRRPAHRITVVGLVSLGAVELGLILASAAPQVAQLSDGIQTVVSVVRTDWIAALAVGLVAWWWGSGWLLALGGLSTVAAFASALPGGLGPAAIPAVLLGVGSIAAGLWPPRREIPVEAPASARRSPIRPTAAATWALAGSLLIVPTLPLGLFSAAMVECFQGCPPLSAFVRPFTPIDMLLIVVLPIAAHFVALASLAGPVREARAAVIGLAGAIFIAFQIVLGQFGGRGFEYLGIAAPATLLMLVGYGAAVWRPADMAGTGRIASLAIGLLAFIWVASGFVWRPDTGSPTYLSAVFEAGVAAVAIAIALGRSTEAVPSTRQLTGWPLA